MLLSFVRTWHLFKDGKVYFTDGLVSQVEEQYFLEYLVSHSEYKLTNQKLELIGNVGLKNVTIFEDPIYYEEEEQYEGPPEDVIAIGSQCACFDKENHAANKLNTEMNTNNIVTTYASCLNDDEDDGEYCKQKFGLPEFGLLQYHALRYLQFCPDF